MIDKILTRNSILLMFTISVIFNVIRMTIKITKMDKIDIDIALVVIILLLFIQFIRTEHKLIGYSVFFIMYASIIMFLNYCIGFPDIVNFILFIPLLLATVYYFFLAWKRFR